MLLLSLHLQQVSGKNRIKTTKAGARYPDARFKEWRTIALFQLKPQLRGQTLPLTGPLRLIVEYYPGDRRARDLDGMLSALTHVFEQARIVENDSQIKALTWREHPVQLGKPELHIGLSLYRQAR